MSNVSTGLKVVGIAGDMGRPEGSNFRLLHVITMILVITRRLIYRSKCPLFSRPLSMHELFCRVYFVPFNGVKVTLFLLVSL